VKAWSQQSRYPTSREKRARCGAPVAWLHILLPKAEGNIEPLLLSLSQNIDTPGSVAHIASQGRRKHRTFSSFPVAEHRYSKLGCTSCFPRPKETSNLYFFPCRRTWVPHISLVFREMWDSTKVGRASLHNSVVERKEIADGNAP
jgi:hypothetical protein